ncbi:cytochrome P450 [Kibdelosporangium banguiense]|uniref:Cytochrome P450 n=1 Tax=Kibdelosporangium banguiense TaxID=1365924 RepID=A0ABS4TPI7_9PSEU|nr:cytochrome P450 [Kibdelosporangium banguiense]MBP2326310.1 cytochrome P450 [Kibdelosporangium banguiense]
MTVQPMEMPGIGTAWLITGYEEARAALTDPRFSRDDRKAPEWLHQHAEQHRIDSSLGRNMLDCDPPEHTRLRQVVKKAFTPRRIEALRPRVQQITDDLLDAMSGHDEVDLIEALAFPLPVTVICELLGLPAADHADFRAWTAGLIQSDDRELTRTSGKALRAYFENRIAGIELDDLPEDEQPDLTRALLRASGDEGRLTREELIDMLMLLLIAGHETTVNLVGNAVVTLLGNPDQLALLRSEPALVPQAIEELLRLDGPLNAALPRITQADVEVSGVTIPAGNMVSIVISVANRDPETFDDPHRVDVTRTDTQHLAFGHGIHFCLGSALARLEAQVAIGGLVARFPELSLATTDLQWRPNPMIRGLVSLPVRTGTRPSA